MTEDKAYAVAKVLGYKFDIVGYAENYEEAEMMQKETQAEYGEGETILIFRYNRKRCVYEQIGDKDGRKTNVCEVDNQE